MEIIRCILCTLLTFALSALGGGWMGPWLSRNAARRKTAMAASFLLLAGIWYVLVWFSRVRAETDQPLWEIADWFAHGGKWYAFLMLVSVLCGAALRDGTTKGWRRPAAIFVGIACAVLTAWRTTPLYPWIPDALARDVKGRIRQTTEHTCGPVSLGNLIERGYARTAPTERELARLTETTIEGTTTRGILAAVRKLGIKIDQCRVMTFAELRALDRPALVSISTLPTVHHATVLLRFDDTHAWFIDPDYGEWRTTIEHAQAILYGKTITLSRP